jgi:hypothetical protein
MYRSGMTGATDDHEPLEERDGRLVISACGVKIDDEIVRSLRYADQR